MEMERTSGAFSRFRAQIGEPRLPPEAMIANPDQRKPMTQADGLHKWVDGSYDIMSQTALPPPPLLSSEQVENRHLWAVGLEDVKYALEKCDFGSNLESGIIKHTNLTGGEAAYSGGELLILEDATVVINGCSGRYGPRSREELELVVAAFAQSGYRVMYMEFDEEAGRPLPFLGVKPKWFQ
ncbi:hypothetical protein FQZ97_1000860 [compost metagenome]